MAKEQRKAGRPKVPKSARKDEALRVPVTAALRRQINAKVPAGGIAAYVRSLIERDLASN